MPFERPSVILYDRWYNLTVPALSTNWRGVAFGLALASLATYQLFKLPPVLPVMLEVYGYDRVLAGGFMSIFAIAGIALSMRIGRGLKRHGLWSYVGGALGLFLVGEGLTLMAPQVGWLMLVARGLEGAGFAICAVAGPLLANINASPRHLSLVFGLTAAWVPIGQVSASLIALPALGAGLWRPLWWVGLGLTVALGLWALRLRGAVGAVNTDMGRNDDSGDDGQPDAKPVERRVLMVGAAIFAIFSGQYYGYMTWLPAFLVETQGFAADGAVWIYLLPTILVLIFNIGTGPMLRAGAPVAPMLAGSLAVQGVIWLTTPYVDGWLGIASLVIYGISCGVGPACLFALPSTIMGGHRVDASAFGIIMTGRNLGVLAGPIVLAQAVALTTDWSMVWPIYGGASLVAAAAAVYLAVRLRALTA